MKTNIRQHFGRHRIVTLAALAILGPACAGPRVPLQVAVKEVATDVSFGGGSNPQDASLPPQSNPETGFVGLVQAPPPVARPRPAGATPRRPSSSQGPNRAAAPARGAAAPGSSQAGSTSPTGGSAGPGPGGGEPQPEGPRPIVCPPAQGNPSRNIVHRFEDFRPPATASYVYQNEGSFTSGGVQGNFPPTSTRRVGEVTVLRSPLAYVWEVSEDLGGNVTTTQYRAEAEGIFITQIRRSFADGSTDTFTPVPFLKLLKFPANLGGVQDQWDASGTDPVTATTMSYHGKNAGLTRISACGTPLYAWNVEISNGRVSGPGKAQSFNGVVALATQYGGISVFDILNTDGVDRGVRVVSNNKANITREPLNPAQG